MRTPIVLGFALWATAALGQSAVRVELNAAESMQGRCRLSFVVENRLETPIDSLKLDLALFGRDGTIRRRIVTELGPVRKAKTIVKSFDVEGGCDEIGSVLVNDVAACAPAALGDCLDRLEPSSRVAGVRFFK